MAEMFALLREDAPMLFARREGAEWRVDERAPGTGSRGRKLSVFVPGTDVLGLAALIPARTEAEARRAAPYAIEDDIGEAVGATHVALGARPETPGAVRRVHAVSKQQMQHWITQLAELGLDDASLIAAHGVMPDGDGLFDAGHLVLGRLGSRTFALEKSVGADVFAGLADGRDGVTIHGHQLATDMRAEAVGEGAPDPAALLAHLADWAAAGDGDLIDLRQGAFQARRAVDLMGIARWRLAASLAAAAILGWFISILLQTQAMQARADELDKRAGEFVAAGWPEAGGDAQRALAQTGADGDGAGAVLPSALGVISILYEGLGSVPGSQLRSLRYDRQRGQLSAVIAFEAFAGADALTRAIEASGLNVRAGDVRQSGDKVVGEVTLEAAR